MKLTIGHIAMRHKMSDAGFLQLEKISGSVYPTDRRCYREIAFDLGYNVMSVEPTAENVACAKQGIINGTHSIQEVFIEFEGA